MTLTIVTEPVALAVPVAPDAKVHLTVEHDQHNGLIDGLIRRATKLVEHRVERQLITATWKLTLDQFPPDCDEWRRPYDWTYGQRTAEIELRRPPVQSITSVVYIDSDGAEQTLAASEYQLDAVSSPARLAPAYGKSWPATRSVYNAVTVTFKAGYGDNSDNSIPHTARQAILMLVGYWYENREAVGTVGTEMAFAFDSLLDDLRWTV